MIDQLKLWLMSVEEEIYHMEVQDLAYNKWYTMLLKKKRWLERSIRKLERWEAKANV